jgi:GAF domain-containing protein
MITVTAWTSALATSWPVLVAAVYLKYSEKFRQRNVLSKERRRQWVKRKLTSGRAMIELHANIASGRTSSKDMRRARESILECIVPGIQERLNLPDGQKVVASLLDFSGGDTRTMTVVARSTRERYVDVTYPSDRLVSWDAIQNGRVAIADDVKTDPRWQNLGGKSYRSVAAIPIYREGKAYGALSIDCEMPYAFLSREADIALQVEPYVAVLTLTYPEGSCSMDCKYNPTHLT